MIAVALYIFDRAVLQIDFDPAAAGAHIASGGFHLVPGLERGVDGGLGHVVPYPMAPAIAIAPGAELSRSQVRGRWRYARASLLLRQVADRRSPISACLRS